MSMYSYSLATNNENSVIDQEIREFVMAENITEAYSKVITIIADLNNISSDYKWTLKSLENCYFVGFDGKAHMNNHCCDDDCDCDCDDDCCENECCCDDSAPMAPQQDKCECECCK